MNKDLKCLYIYLSEACNLNCQHCWQAAPSSTSKARPLQFSECAAFLDDALALGLQSVTLSGGEPLLNPDFSEFCEYFHSNGVTCTVETNGTLITGKNIGTIHSTEVYCAISLDGRKEGTHDAIRRHPGAYRRTLDGLRLLEARGLRYQIIMSITRSNYAEVSDLLQWLSSDWPSCNAFKINVVLPFGRAEELAVDGLLFRAAEYPQLIREIGEMNGRFRLSPMLHINPAFFPLAQLTNGTCCGGYCGFTGALSILPNGEVSICSLGKHYPQYAYGHVSQVNLQDLWNDDPLLTGIHTDAYKRLTGVCSKCVHKKVCVGGCRAFALRAYDDIFAPSPSCQRMYDINQFPPSRLVQS